MSVFSSHFNSQQFAQAHTHTGKVVVKRVKARIHRWRCETSGAEQSPGDTPFGLLYT